MRKLLVFFSFILLISSTLLAGISKELKKEIEKKYLNQRGRLKVALSTDRKLILRISKEGKSYGSGVGLFGRKIDASKLRTRGRRVISEDSYVTVHKVKAHDKDIELEVKDDKGQKGRIKVFFPDELTDDNFSYDELDRLFRKAVSFKSFAELHPDWEPEVIELIEKYEVKIGMNEDQVIESLGNPDGIKMSASGEVTKSEWVYKLGKNKKRKLIFHNSILNDIKNIEE